MDLNQAQLLTLKAAIAAETNATFVGYRTTGQTGAMANWYNVISNTDAWNTSVDKNQLNAVSTYTNYDTIAAGKRDAWSLFLGSAPQDMSQGKLRNTVTDVWGPIVAASVGEEILKGCRRKSTRGENVFGGTVASTGTVSATKLDVIGQMTDQNILDALAA
jgi:hypothetical protein